MTKKLAKLVDAPGRRPGRPRTSARAELARQAKAQRFVLVKDGLDLASWALQDILTKDGSQITQRDLTSLDAARRFLASLVGVARRGGGK